MNLDSVVVHLPTDCPILNWATFCIHELVSSEINSKHGIRILPERANSNPVNLNVFREAALRQYYGDLPPNSDEAHDTSVQSRFTYGVAERRLSVGTDPTMFVTRQFSPHMLAIADHLHDMLKKNVSYLNLESVDISHKLNHMTVLIYTADGKLKPKSSMGFHSDGSYTNAGLFSITRNCQVENTPTVVFSLGNARDLNWRRRFLKKNVWVSDNSWGASYCIGNNTITIINPKDENPLSEKNISDLLQYLHGGVNVNSSSGSKISCALVFRSVNSIRTYNVETDTMCSDGNGISLDAQELLDNFNSSEYHRNLNNLYKKLFF